jgi:hypothetical protein
MAWQRGEFRLVHEFVRRYVRWTKAPPRTAKVGEPVIISGAPLSGVAIEAITVHHEAFPAPMTAAAASAIPRYSLPDKRKEYLPRLKSEYTRNSDGSLAFVKREYSDGRRGDFYLGKDGDFAFTVPFPEGAGVYTVVVWVKRPGYATAVSASNVSIRVEESLQKVVRASTLGR